MQIVQELCKRPNLNRTGFEMPTIYVPTMNQKGSSCVNQIEEVCQDIEKTINQTIQNTLNSLERDCDNIATLVEEKLQKNMYVLINFSSFINHILKVGLNRNLINMLYLYILMYY